MIKPKIQTNNFNLLYSNSKNMNRQFVFLSIVLALVVLSQSTSKFLYSYPHSSMDYTYLTSYYYFSNLTPNSTLKIRVKIPSPTANSHDLKLIVPLMYDGIDQLTLATPSVIQDSSCQIYDCVWTWQIPDTKKYLLYLSLVDTVDTMLFMEMVNILITSSTTPYSNDVVELVRSTDIFRDQVVKYLYVAADKISTFTLYPVND